jgi:hypothetical protein
MSIISSEHGVDTVSSGGGHAYSEDYKNRIFIFWYKNGKLGGRRLREIIEPDEITGATPSAGVLANWIMEFKNRAVFLDEQVSKELQDRLVAEKVEMHTRHAKVGVSMQDMAMEYLENHKDEIKVPVAVKMLVDGIEIERASRGVPQALAKMMNKTDEDILKDVQELLNRGSVEFEQVEVENGDVNE